MKKAVLYSVIGLIAFGCHHPVNKTQSDSTFNRIVCMSTTHIAALTALGYDSLIVGVSGAGYITNQRIKEGLHDRSIVDIGYEAAIDFETLISLKPDIVLAYDINGENTSYIDKIRQLGINVKVIDDFTQSSPIERLDILHIFGQLLNCEDKADSIINSITNRYDSLKRIANSYDTIKVLLNAPWKDVWYVPCENSYMSRIVQDAAGVVVGALKNKAGSFPYGIEEMFLVGKDAQYWLLQNTVTSLKQLESENHLLAKIPAYVQDKVYNNSLRMTEGGGNDYWETGFVEPDKILEDIIRILHPDALMTGEFHYYEKIE